MSEELPVWAKVGTIIKNPQIHRACAVTKATPIERGVLLELKMVTYRGYCFSTVEVNTDPVDTFELCPYSPMNGIFVCGANGEKVWRVIRDEMGFWALARYDVKRVNP